MELRHGGTRAATTAAGAGMLTGFAAVLHGALHNNLARTLGGTCLTLVAITVVALILIRRWIVDTSQERALLAAAQREAQSQKSVYIAAQAALEVEQGRLTRDMAAERRHLAVRLAKGRKQILEEFEEKRAALIAETMEATMLMVHGGKLAPTAATTGNLIHFPHQHQQPEQTRSRDHGVVRP